MARCHETGRIQKSRNLDQMGNSQLPLPNKMNLFSFLVKRNRWSLKTFGEGKKTTGILKHIHAELDEVQAKPDDLTEWVDVILLAFDGAYRQGFTPYDVCNAIEAKHEINTKREWPKVADDEPTFHSPPR